MCLASTGSWALHPSAVRVRCAVWCACVGSPRPHPRKAKDDCWPFPQLLCHWEGHVPFDIWWVLRPVLLPDWRASTARGHSSGCCVSDMLPSCLRGEVDSRPLGALPSPSTSQVQLPTPPLQEKRKKFCLWSGMFGRHGLNKIKLIHLFWFLEIFFGVSSKLHVECRDSSIYSLRWGERSSNIRRAVLS